MPAPRKFIFHGQVYLVSFRTERGLPLVPTDLINEIIYAAMARAQELYPVTICAFVFEPNHGHAMLMVHDPEDFCKFVGFVKQEIAHAVNRLLGRRRQTVWAARFDSPILLTFEDILKYFKYIFTNPVKDGLISSPALYPGVCSWKMLLESTQKRECLSINRDSLYRLFNPEQPYRESEDRLRILKKRSEGKFRFLTIEPFAWRDNFIESKNLTESEIKSLIVALVEDEVRAVALDRNEKGLKTPSPISLQKKSMIKEYYPKKFGRRMVCICSDRDLRKTIISFYHWLADRARFVYQRWKIGDYSLPFPSGLFPPSLPRIMNPLSMAFAG